MFIHWAQKPHNLDEWSHELTHADSQEQQEQKQLRALRSRRSSYAGTNMNKFSDYHGRARVGRGGAKFKKSFNVLWVVRLGRTMLYQR